MEIDFGFIGDMILLGLLVSGCRKNLTLMVRVRVVVMLIEQNAEDAENTEEAGSPVIYTLYQKGLGYGGLPLV